MSHMCRETKPPWMELSDCHGENGDLRGGCDAWNALQDRHYGNVDVVGTEMGGGDAVRSQSTKDVVGIARRPLFDCLIHRVASSDCHLRIRRRGDQVEETRK